jgi:Importin-beta N-terminal domain
MAASGLDFNDLWATLQSTLLNDNTARRAAEKRLQEMSVFPGYLSALLHLSTVTDVPLSARISGIVAMKRAVEKGWHNDDPTAPKVYSVEEKDAVRAKLIESAVIQKDLPMLNAFADMARCIFRHDYPDRWCVTNGLWRRPESPNTALSDSLLAPFLSSLHVFICRSALPAQLTSQLTSGDPNKAAISCLLIRQFCKVYDQSLQGAAVLNALLDAVMPILASIAKFVLASGASASAAGGDQAIYLQANSSLAADTIRFILKALYSCCDMHLGSHPSINKTENFVGWCGIANDCLKKHLPDPALGETGPGQEPSGQPLDVEARARWPWWKAKKWAAKLFHRIADRWGQPLLIDVAKKSKKGAPAMTAEEAAEEAKRQAEKNVATLFNKHISVEVCKTILSMLHDWRRSNRWVSPRFLLYGLHALQTCVDFSSCWEPVIKPAAPFLVEEVILPMMAITGHEYALFLEDPQEYIRIQQDPMESHVSPRQSAVLLCFALLKVRKRTTEPLLDGVFARGLVGQSYGPSQGPNAGSALALPLAGEDYSQCSPNGEAAASPEDIKAIQREGLLYLVQTNLGHLCGKKKRRQHVEGMLRSQITPALKHPHPALRARAAAVWGSYIGAFQDDEDEDEDDDGGYFGPQKVGKKGGKKKDDDTFKFKDENTVKEAVEGLFTQLDDPVLTVRLVSGGVLCKFLQASEVVRKMIEPHVALLLDKLFGLLEGGGMGVDEVVTTVQQVIECYQESIPALALGIVTKLIKVFSEVIREGRDETDGGLADEASMAGEGALQAIRAVLDGLLESKNRALYLQVVQQCWPLLDFLFTADTTHALAEGSEMAAIANAAAAATGGTVVGIGGVAMTEFFNEALDLYGDIIVALSGEIGDESNTVDDLVPVTDHLWVLLPKVLLCYTSGALDYTRDLLYPLDCLMQYSKSRLSAARDPATGLDNAALLCNAAAFVEAKTDERERGYFSKIIIGLLHFCRGLIDRLVPGIATLYAKAALFGHTKLLRSQACAVLGACFMYSVPLTLQGLELVRPRDADPAAVFPPGMATASVLASICESAGRGYFKRSLDVKMTIMGLTLLLGTPVASLALLVVEVLPQMLAAVAYLDNQYDDLLKTEAEQRELEEEAEREAQEWGGRMWGDDDDDEEDGINALLRDADGDADDDDEEDDADPTKEETFATGDYVHQDDLAYHTMLARTEQQQKEKEEAKKLKAASAGPQHIPLADGDEELDEVGAPPAETPLDHINHRLWLNDAIQALATQPQGQALQASVDPTTKSLLSALVTKAHEERAAGKVPGNLGPAPLKLPEATA